jgi:hypothetical protein
MLPRALIGPVMAVARGPARPPLEARLVRQAVDAVAPRSAPREPLARDLARRVVEELVAFLSEPDDPLLAALGEVSRKAFPSPITALAVDSEVDTLALFIDLRVEALRSRSGRGLSPNADAAERRAILAQVERRLARRYLRHLRAA